MTAAAQTATAESPFRRLLQTSTRYRAVCWRASIFSILNKIFDIAPEVLIGVAVDIVVTREQSFLGRFGLTDGKDQLYALALLTLAIWICESLFEYLFSLDWRRLAQTVQHDLRLEAYQHVQNLDVAFFEERSAGGLVSILNDDINQLERFLDGGANALLQVMTSVVVIGGIFFYLAPQVAVWAMLPIPVILIGAFYYQRRAEPLYAEVRAKAALLGGKLAANLSGITTIKAQTAEAHEAAAIRRESEAYLKSNGRAIAVSSAFIPLIRMAVLSGFIATLVLGGLMAWDGELAVGSYGVLVFLTQRLLWPLTSLAQTVDLYQRAAASTTRILDLLATPIVSPRGNVKLNRTSVRGALAFDRVSFAYTGRAPLFDGLDLTMPAGSKTAIVGATGSGKSTIAKLLLRFYEPTGGVIRLDGQALSEIDAVSLRQLIGFVGQDLYLFDGTVRENIAYGNFTATTAEIEAAAKVADAHEFVAKLPRGYDTIVGERGTKLSGGQRQRIAIARAVLKDPPILLLDEATSAVDNESERLIQRALERVAVGRTTLMIAHRLSTVMNCDTIHVVDGGRIVETGKHADLIAKKGAYARLWAAQGGPSS
jgi:ATP-binding cassette subfamily B protein